MICDQCKLRDMEMDILKAQGERRSCEQCGKPMGRYIHMQGAGFASATIDHYHTTPLPLDARPDGTPDPKGRHKPVEVPISKELCYTCYLEDFKVAYPKEPLPVIANVATN